jgi:tetratricopeptide (TPR) repeat protein
MVLMFGELITESFGLGPPSCPPCYGWNANTQRCDPPDESCECCFGGCCDKNLCESCGTEQFTCKVCGGDPNKTCCDGECIIETCTLGMSETETLLKFGWYSFSQGKWQEAISYFEKGLAKLPNDNKPTNVLYGLARMYENTGNKTKAIETYRQLLSIMKDKEPEIQMVQTRILSLEEKIEQ